MDRLFSKRAVILALAALATTACFHTHESRTTIEQSWPAAGVKALEVRGVNGRIEIEATAGTAVTMKAEVSVSGRDENINKGDVLDIDVVGDTISVVERGRSRRGFFVFGRGGQRVDFHFGVPRNTSLDIETVNGRIVVDNVNGELELQSVNGRIEATTGNANLYAKTVNGRVIATFTEAFTGARVKTVNGSVEINVPEGTQIACDVHQVNGSFRSEIPVRMGETQNGERVLEVSTVNGSVTLHQIGGDATTAEVVKTDGVPPLPDIPDLPDLPEPPEPPAGQ